MEQSRGVRIIILLTGVVIGCLYALDLRNDYYYYFTKEESFATVTDLTRVEENEPYILRVSYLNKYLNTDIDCRIKLDGRYGRKFEEEIPKKVMIYYTKKSACNIYLQDYLHPRLGSFAIHFIIFFIALYGIFLFTKKASYDFQGLVP